LALARRRPAGWVVAAIGVVVVAFSESLTGHAAASSRPALQSAVDVAHVLGAGGWLGGLTVIVLCALPAVRRAEPSGTAMSQQLVRAFHRSATECVTIVLITAVLG